MTVKLDITKEQWDKFKIRAQEIGTSRTEILSELVRCICWEGNGSDERRLANDWLDRESGNYFDPFID